MNSYVCITPQLAKNSRSHGTNETQSFQIRKLESIIDKIDAVLTKRYGHTEKELDTIINYDIRY